MSTPTARDAVKSLVVDRCLCGGPKMRGNALCRSCWRRLPENLRRPLTRRVGQGYEAAYIAAAAHLMERP